MKTKVLLILSGLAAILLVLCAWRYFMEDRRPPQIDVPFSQVSYQEGQDPRILLNGVTATDDRDGDVSKSLRADRIFFSEDGTRVCVTFAAKDSHHNVSKRIVWFTLEAE